MELKRLVAKCLRAILQPPAITKSCIDTTARVCSGTQVNYSSLGRYTYVGHDAFLVNAEIGSFCSIADNCRIGGANHDMNRLSTSPVFSSGRNILGKNFAFLEDAETPITHIGSDVWIGAGSIILSGIIIGNGAVIGAGSVLTKNVGPYEIWAGNPAKMIRKRFDDSTIQELLESEWWTAKEEELYNAAPYADDVKAFLEEFSK